MSDKLNETFQKHLKLLHKHLNINEGYGDAAHLDWAMRDPGQRPDWDPDGITGIKQPSSYREPKTIADYAKEVGWSDSMTKTYIYWLNNRKDSRGGWQLGSPYNNMGDSYEFHQWMKDEKLAAQFAAQSKKDEELSNEVKNVSDKLKTPMSSLIKTFGTIGWQKYKRLDTKGKITRLLTQALIPDNKEKLKIELGSNYNELVNRLKAADYKKKENDIKIMGTTIKKAEKLLGRGFFE